MTCSASALRARDLYDAGYDRRNPARLESAEEARAIDERIAVAWGAHPHRTFVDNEAEFVQKLTRVIELLRLEVPPCCREHKVAELEGTARSLAGTEAR